MTSNDSVEKVKMDLPEPLIYANADEFHVKSTVVYIGERGEDKVGNLYLDKALTKPVYNDKLERLFLAGGLKIAKIDSNSGALLMYSPLSVVFDPKFKNMLVRTTAGDFSAHVRPTEDSLPSAGGHVDQAGPSEEEK